MSVPAAQRPRIVVGVDGSAPSKDALEWAARQALLTGSSIDAVTGWHLPSMAYGASVTLPGDLDLEGSARDVLEHTVTDVLGDHPEVTVRTLVEEGPAAYVLTQAAAGADLLVVGSRGHGAFSGLLLGSVSEHCAAHAPCPVVIVRHLGQDSGAD